MSVRAGARVGGVRTALAAALAAFSIGVPSILGGASALAAPARPNVPPPGTTCNVFPADNIWNTDISQLPVNSHSADWLSTMHSGSTNLHPDFGGPPYGMPFAVVDDTYPKVKIRFHYKSESDRKPYPFGPDIPIEKGSDHHALVIDSDTCVLYELFGANWNDGKPKAGSGAIFDLGSNALRPDRWTSADAAGLPIFPGLVRYDEVKAGFIGHAIRMTADLTDCHHIWPARHDAGTCNAKYPPMGARFRMKANFSMTGFSADAKVILQAMKTYGFFLTDNGSDWYFQGTMDKRWKNSLLDELKSIPASAFEAVDGSGCMVDPDSAEASCQ